MNEDLFNVIQQSNGYHYQTFDVADADLTYFPRLFSKTEAQDYFNQLLEQIEWRQEWINLFGNDYKVPRLSAWYGDANRSYTYSGIATKAKPWIVPLLAIKQRVEIMNDCRFNSVLVNRYRDGSDAVAWHSDDEPELGRNPIIGSVSFGAVRPFQLKHKSLDSQRLTIDLASGSYLLMKGETQHYWQHQIPKTKKSVVERINLTFRVVSVV